MMLFSELAAVHPRADLLVLTELALTVLNKLRYETKVFLAAYHFLLYNEYGVRLNNLDVNEYKQHN
jgi:hypothetical protein